MKAAIVPGFSELTITVDPARKATREGPPSIIMPWLYAPWPEARQTGVAEIEVKGETLRALLTELAYQYKRVNVDLIPINPRTNEVDFDYDILVNGQSYVSLPGALDARLKAGDEVRLKMSWRWDG